jgi:hypothetical protein
MRAIIRERFEPINEERIRRLDQSITEYAPHPVPLAAIYDALFRPLFTGFESAPVNDTTLVQIVGRALSEPADFTRSLHQEFFAELSLRFIKEIQRTCPQLAESAIHYRFYLSINTMIGTMIEQVCLENISAGKLDSNNHDTILQELTAFVVAGFQQE